MTKQWTLTTFDGKTIYGLQDTRPGNDKAILLIHGMTGAPEELQHQAAADFFPAQGYDVIRPYLYCDQSNARRFEEATFALHGKDTELVARHFLENYKTFYAAGHSYGGPSILSSDTSLYAAICLWDPSFKKTNELSSSFVWDEKRNAYFIEWEPETKVGEAMLEESRRFDHAFSIALAENCKAPLRVIYAGDGDYVLNGESYNDFVKTQSDSKIVPGTTHCFTEDGTTQPLLDYTKEWFDKFQPK